MKNVIVGLGTGRCGTVSLANLLNLQDNTVAKHEPLGHRASYIYNKAVSNEIISKIKAEKNKNVAVISLNYISYFEDIYKHFENVNLLILKRDKAEVIESYKKKMKQNGRNANHWVEHNGRKWTHDKWDKCYPKFNAKSIDEAIGKYWDFYYSKVDEITNKLNINYQLVKTKDLNDKEIMMSTLKKIGYSSPKYKKIQKNRQK